MKNNSKAVRSGTANQPRRQSEIILISPPSRQCYELYEQMKKQFLIDYPDASHKEFEIACQHFCKKLGL